MSFNIPIIIAGASIVSSFFPIVIFSRRWKEFSRKYLRILFAFIVVCALSDTLGALLANKKLPTYLVFNFSDLLQFSLLSWLYYEAMRRMTNERSLSVSYLIKVGVILYFVTLLAISFFSQNPFNQHQNFAWVVSAAIVIIYTSIYFNRLMVLIPSQRVLKVDMFLWVNSGIAYYFSFTIVLFLLENLLVSKLSSETYILIWSYNNINNIVKNVLITIGLVYYSSESEP